MPGEKQKSDRRIFRVVIVAGEASGDFHGANLVRELRRIEPDIELTGIGGACLREVGVELIADVSQMSVVGLTEVLSRAGLILSVFFKLKNILKDRKPDLLILIDYSGFNLPLARAAKKEGIRVLYYISPQVWASRRGRIKKIRRTVDRMAVIIPFEPAIYEKEGVKATFVGHPLIDAVRRRWPRAEAFRTFKLEEGRPTLGILPGSRPGEIKRLLPLMLQTALILKRSIPRLQFILPLANTLNPKEVSDMVSGFGLDVAIVQDAMYDAVGISDAAIVASGTATLETALLEIPMIIVYKVSGLTYQVGKRFVYIDKIGLVNIIAGKAVVPEFVQNDARPEEMANALSILLTEEPKRNEMIKELRRIRTLLGEEGAAGRAARIAYDLMTAPEI